MDPCLLKILDARLELMTKGFIIASFGYFNKSLIVLHATRNEKKHNETIILTKNKLNNIESKTSEALINTEISHEDFMTIINEERNYR